MTEPAYDYANDPMAQCHNPNWVETAPPWYDGDLMQTEVAVDCGQCSYCVWKKEPTL